MLNIYTSHTHHIHKERDYPCTCCVYVVYVLDKHVHAFNFMIISIVRGDFPECVRVCRLILKKIPPQFWLSIYSDENLAHPTNAWNEPVTLFNIHIIHPFHFPMPPSLFPLESCPYNHIYGFRRHHTLRPLALPIVILRCET